MTSLAKKPVNHTLVEVLNKPGVIVVLFGFLWIEQKDEKLRIKVKKRKSKKRREEKRRLYGRFVKVGC